ncbi:MAG: GTP 3',8-cyclase MoaA [Syntrophaceticus sp.]|nr:GTP 3',8-cyclase MoaA [Syntrophaceticus sp.]
MERLWERPKRLRKIKAIRPEDRSGVIMEDRFGRQIKYLRISITDRCNLRCVYCMPPEGITSKPREEILRMEEILRVAEVALQLGINKFRLTGGEPLLRKGVIPFIKALSTKPEVEDIAITTNGTLLLQLAERLKDARAKRLNISLDTLDEEKYRQITRGGSFKQVWAGIEKVLALGFEPVKINTVALRDFNDEEVVDFARLTLEYPLHVRFIELMPIGSSWEMADNSFISCGEVKSKVEKVLGELQPVSGVRGSGPADNFTIPGAKGSIGFIHAMSNHFCASCNRLRLTADGKLRPCLHDQHEVNLQNALRSGAGDKELQQLFQKAVDLKPENHHLATGAPVTGRGMCQIGG